MTLTIPLSFVTERYNPGAGNIRKASPLLVPDLREADASCANLTQVRMFNPLAIRVNVLAVTTRLIIDAMRRAGWRSGTPA